jgi:hypothetical protein
MNFQIIAREKLKIVTQCNQVDFKIKNNEIVDQNEVNKIQTKFGINIISIKLMVIKEH